MSRQAALTIFLKHQPLIRAYALSICRDYQMVEDVTQEVALALCNDPDRPPQGDAQVKWIKAVVRNLTLKALRGVRRTVALSDGAIEAISHAYRRSNSDDLARRCDAVARCMESVRGTTRTVLERHYGRGERPGRIAEALGRTVSAVYSILKRGRAILAACVRRRLEEGGAA